MGSLTRRAFLKVMGAGGAAATLGVLEPRTAAAATAGARVVVVGGGFGGATCANFLRRYAPAMDVTLVETSEKLVTCPFSNTVIGGINSIEYITHGYETLRDTRGCNVVHDTVIEINPVDKSVRLQGGNSLSYDRVVVSPGIGFDWSRIEGYDQSVSKIFPHAWMGGPQILLLRQQLESMVDGGVVIVSPPPRPYRAPPAPFERASLIANYLKKYKRNSKVLILDPNADFPKQRLFEQGWNKLYRGMIERVNSSGGNVVRVDAAARTLYTQSGAAIHGDVINLIPAQQAGKIAYLADLVDESGWCPVKPTSFESTRHDDVYVIGDACIAGDMPKSAFAANSQAKACAAAIIASFNGDSPPDPTFPTAFYSLIGPKYGVSEASVCRVIDGRITEISGGMSPEKATNQVRFNEAKFAAGWYKAIMAEMLAK